MTRITFLVLATLALTALPILGTLADAPEGSDSTRRIVQLLQDTPDTHSYY